MHPNLNRFSGVLRIVAAFFPLVAFASITQADIFQWEYIDPADPTQGKRQSTTLAPDGAGVDAVPGADLAGRDLTMAYLMGANLSGAYLIGADLSGADFSAVCFWCLYGGPLYRADLTAADLSHANVSNAIFEYALFADANFTGADVRGAHFSFTSPTAAQLYSTASYQVHNLTGIGFLRNNLGGWNFVTQNLTNADFGFTRLEGADFTDAEVRGAQFYQVYDYPHRRTGIALAQLYSTASYKAHDLRAINLNNNNLAGGNFAGQNLTNAYFEGATLTGADFRGAIGGTFHIAKTTNLIGHDGSIYGLDLSDGGLLVVRDYDGNSLHIPITVDQHLAMGPGGTLRMVFDADAWDSTISFAPGIPVTLGGTLELMFAADVNLASQVGRTFDLFDWTGVNPTGAFTVSSPYAWDLSNLYSTGEVTLTAIPEPGTLLMFGFGLAALFPGCRVVQCHPRRVLHAAVAMFPLVALATTVRADIFQWEYINPADPSQGKQQSTTLAPDGAGVDAVPGADLAGRDLTKAHLISADLHTFYYSWCNPYIACPPPKKTNLSRVNLTDADLTSANLYDAYVVDANLRNTNLSNADLSGTTLTNANFTGAEVRGARFASGAYGGSGITLAQLYSTASYQAGDLSGIDFYGNNLAGGNFTNQNLTNASFAHATLAGADFTQAKLINVRFYYANLTRANFAGHNLTNGDFSFATLTDANFRNTNLSNATFWYATLSHADFTNAEVRGASFSGTEITLKQLYSTASYQARDLTGIELYGNNLTGADFSGQNLTNAHFYYTKLTDADFIGAEVRGANIGNSGLTLAQLYSTASYQANDLSGIRLTLSDLVGGNFAGQNLTNADFYCTKLTDAVFTGAEVRGASFYRDSYTGTGGISLAQLYSTASYQAKDLSAVILSNNDLAGGNFAGQNLFNANLSGATLMDADFTGAEVRGASFSQITTAQLYSTASYQAHDLTGIALYGDLTGWNFAGQNLTDANFSGATLSGADFTGAELSGINLSGNDLSSGDFAGQNFSGASFVLSNLTDANFRDATLTNVDFGAATLSGANLRGANLTNANFDLRSGCYLNGICPVDSAKLNDADLTAADTRGAVGLDVSDATTANLIRPDGHISGLNLDAGGLLVVRDHDGNPKDEYGSPISPVPILITIDQHQAIGVGGTLRMVFEADAWDSTISFAPGIPVTLGGTLELTFTDDVNLAGQLGRTFDLFDWTGVTPTGAFAISKPYAWDISNLYTSGEVTLTAIPEPDTLFLLGFGLTALVAIDMERFSTFYVKQRISS